MFERYGSSKLKVEYERITSGSKNYIQVKYQDDTFILTECSTEYNESAYYISTQDELKCDNSETNTTFYHRTGGILMMAKTCGIIMHCSDILGGESVILVAEMIEETLEQVKTKVEVIVYDDRCHLTKYKDKKLYPTQISINVK